MASKLEFPLQLQRQYNAPLDVNSKVETLTDLETLKNSKNVYEGMLTYCVESSTLYIFNKNGKFEPVSNNQSATYDTLETTDKTLVGAINEVNGNSLDTVGFSADYKNIILNRKSGLNPYTIPISTIINNASLTELKDVDSTDIGNGKTLVYDETTSKHKYVDTTGTDEFVKMDSATDAKYLGDLIDKSTVINDNGTLKVKKLDGQEVTITEINYLKGLTMNIMDLVNVFANGGVKVWETPVDTYADLLALDRSTFIDGISYIVYVLVDETHADAKTTYLCDKTSSTFFGNADSQRNFVTNPIDLANEVTGKLPTDNIDVDSLWNLLTINNTYKTLTTNNEVFGTHGAKALYDELVTVIGGKANGDDLVTHTSDTDIHTSATEKASYVKKTDITTTIDGTSTNTQVPSAKTIYDNAFIYRKVSNIDCEEGSWVTQFVEIPTSENGTFPSNGDWLKIEQIKAKDFLHQICTCHTPDGSFIGMYVRHAWCYATKIENAIWSSWQKICTTSVADVPKTAITWSDETNYKSSYTGCHYVVKNGICYVALDINIISESSKGVKLKDNSLPKSSFDYIHRSIPPHNSMGEALTLSVVNGVITLYNGTNGCRYLGSFSYPVAES